MSPERTSPRQTSFDALRGLAIVTMIIDHATLMLLGVVDLGWNGRAIGRLAEPLFTLLLGYFLFGRTRRQVLSRWRHLVAAELVVLPIFFGVTGTLDILVNFLVAILIYVVMRDKMVWLLPLFILSGVDPTGEILSYPLALTTSQVALGLVLRQPRGWLAALPFLMAPMAMTFEQSVPSVVTVFASALLLLARHHPDQRVGWLEAMGRRPLTWYAAHIVVLAVLGFAIGRMGGLPYVEYMLTRTYTYDLPLLRP